MRADAGEGGGGGIGVRGVAEPSERGQGRTCFLFALTLEQFITFIKPVKLALAYYAFALGRPSECLTILDGVDELTDVSTRVASYDTMHREGGSLKTSDPSAATSRSGTVLSSWSTVTNADASDGRMWGMIESVRSICLQGMF